jgi:Tfp pilus assembly protein PilF
MAGTVRGDDHLLVRLVLSAAQQGQRVAAAQIAATYLQAHPQSIVAARLSADYAASIGDWGRARMLLENIGGQGGMRDVRLLCDLAYAQLRLGNTASAEETASKALSLQPASPVAAQALAMALKARKQEPELADALLARASRP